MTIRSSTMWASARASAGSGERAMYRAAPQSFTAEFDENLTIQVGADADDGRAFDAHVSADPAAMLLLMLHRVKPAPLALRGKVVVWGRRPWRVPRMVAAMMPP